MFLFWDRISWFTCYYRNYLFISSTMTYISLSFYRKSSSRSRGWYLILTFCRCCMIILIHLYLLLRILIFYNMKTNFKPTRNTVFIKSITLVSTLCSIALYRSVACLTLSWSYSPLGHLRGDLRGVFVIPPL